MNYKTLSNDNYPAVAESLPNSISHDLDIFELKQLADKEALYKARCQKAIQSYKHWCKSQEDQTDIIEILYGSMEGRIYRGQAEDTIKLYWAIRKHFRKAFFSYLDKTGCYRKDTKIAA
ncbi:MAG: hypothetical protein HRT94_03230 [Alphaproteobacteria bacterium]|nr:hypothetical protein [Alphaproteobacteria bacterium]